MSRHRLPSMTREGWLKLAQSKNMQKRIASDPWMDNYQPIMRVMGERKTLDWDGAVAALHMVYAWMPTMLRPLPAYSEEEKRSLLRVLNAVKRGALLETVDLERVKRFANRSIVGASKLLHALNPETYAIWDSRVADQFLWRNVAPATYCTTARYEEYLSTIRDWILDPEVIRQCARIRRLNSGLAKSPDLRLVELIIFRGRK